MLAVSTAFDYGVKTVLGEQDIADTGIMLQQPHAAKAPFAFTGEVKKIIRIDRLMRPMKPANSDVGNTLPDFATIIGRHPHARPEQVKILFV